MNNYDAIAAVANAIHEVRQHDMRQQKRALDWPDAGQVFGDPSKPYEWRQVCETMSGMVFYNKLGELTTYTPQENWAEWVRQPGIVNITAKLS